MESDLTRRPRQGAHCIQAVQKQLDSIAPGGQVLRTKKPGAGVGSAGWRIGRGGILRRLRNGTQTSLGLVGANPWVAGERNSEKSRNLEPEEGAGCWGREWGEGREVVGLDFTYLFLLFSLCLPPILPHHRSLE